MGSGQPRTASEGRPGGCEEEEKLSVLPPEEGVHSFSVPKYQPGWYLLAAPAGGMSIRLVLGQPAGAKAAMPLVPVPRSVQYWCRTASSRPGVTRAELTSVPHSQGKHRPAPPRPAKSPPVRGQKPFPPHWFPLRGWPLPSLFVHRLQDPLSRRGVALSGYNPLAPQKSPGD